MINVQDDYPDLVSMNGINVYYKQNPGSLEAFKRAQCFLPSGITRAVLYWPPFPIYLRAGRGTKIWDVDGNERIDFNFNNTTLILGHNHPKVIEAVEDQLSRGTVLGAPTETECILAEEIVTRLKSAEQVRFTPSGTEANMQAIRTARSFTKKDLIAKCEGAYHGSWDAVDVSVSPPVDELSPWDNPKSDKQQTGVPKEVLKNTLIIPFNDAEIATTLIKKHKDKLAAVIIEPVQRDLPPVPGYLEAIREVTEQHDILLIFDEVISFRVSYSGAQGKYEVIPDITTMGKIIGGGFPVGAYSSYEELMEPLTIPATKFPEYKKPRLGFSGTFNAHPIAMTAGLAVIKELRPQIYNKLDSKGDMMRRGIQAIFEEIGVNAFVGGTASFFPIIWTSEKVRDYKSAITGNRKISRSFSIELMNLGVFLLGHPNISAVTSKEDINFALDKIRKSIENLFPIIKSEAQHLINL
jgi:glutamate-1-semialdehyde 2,1-aminomutase